MTREKQIEILMADRCTKSEAEKLLKLGTIIFDEKSEFLEHINEGMEEDEDKEPYTLDDVKNGWVENASVTNYEGKEFYIVYIV